MTEESAVGDRDGHSVPAEPPAVDALPEPPAVDALPEPPASVSFWFNLAKVAGQGEDSDPILRLDPHLALLGVFDGMGGAGGTVYATAEGARTGAYIGARVARDAVEQRIVDLDIADDEIDAAALAEDLRSTVERALQDRLTVLNAPRSGLRSSLLRALPTTMALAVVQRRGLAGQSWICYLFWAGDSRLYLLHPESGVHQLTVDDIRDRGDAMANLREDSVVSNAMSADTPFQVHHGQLDLVPPFVLISATDGCFGYWPSPMHFEALLLTTLAASTDAESWSRALQEQISAVTGDDAAAAILAIGADHGTLQSLSAARTAVVEQEWVGTLDQLSAQIGQLERELQDLRQHRTEQAAALWGRYRLGYEKYLAGMTMKENAQ